MEKSSRKILVVEDDRSVAVALMKNLTLEGYTNVIHAADGAIAWDLMFHKHQEFDLVITDNQMPRLRGIDLIRKMSHFSPQKEIPVIIMSSDIGLLRELARSLGVRMCIEKPFDIDKLFEEMEKVFAS